MLRTPIAAIVLVAATIVFASLILIIGPFDRRKNFVGKLVGIWGHIVMAGTFVPQQTIGAENIPSEACIFVSNHTSALDIIAQISAIPRYFVFLAKKELFRIPLFGWAMATVGMVKVDRQNRERAKKSVDNTVTRLKARPISLMIYPEGTRSKTEEMLPFKRGGFVLAILTGMPIVPVAIEGAREVMPKNAKYLRSGNIRVTICPPIETRDCSIEDRFEIMESTRKAIEGVLARN